MIAHPTVCGLDPGGQPLGSFFSDSPPKRLSVIYDAALRAVHARTRHTRDCAGCAQCVSAQQNAQAALGHYRDALAEVFG